MGNEPKKTGNFVNGLAILLFFVGFGSIIFSAGTTQMTLLIFILFTSISMLAGVSMTVDMRSFLGLPFLLIYLFIFTSQAPAMVGQAVFGYWWPQVQTFSETYLSPLGNAMGEAQSGLGDVWLMLTNPQLYFLRMQQKDQVKSIVMTGGTSMSIETDRFELLPSVTGIVEPTEPITGVIDLENKGDFKSDRIDLGLSIDWVDPTTNALTNAGTFTYLACINALNPSPPGGNPTACNWTETTYPREKKAVSFTLSENSWDLLGTECKDEGGDCTCFSDCTPGNMTYRHSGETVRVFSNVSFNYYVNVSIPLSMLNETLYLEKIKAGEQVLMTNVTSEYTGGPVKVAIFIPNQPARTGQKQLVVASIQNAGSGELLRVNYFTLTFYRKDISSVEKIASTFRTTDYLTDGCGSVTPSGDTLTITCNNTFRPLKNGEFKRVSFYVTPSTTTISDERTTQIIGWANYYYMRSQSQTLTVANAPPQ